MAACICVCVCMYVCVWEGWRMGTDHWWPFSRWSQFREATFSSVEQVFRCEMMYSVAILLSIIHLVYRCTFFDNHHWIGDGVRHCHSVPQSAKLFDIHRCLSAYVSGWSKMARELVVRVSHHRRSTFLRQHSSLVFPSISPKDIRRRGGGRWRLQKRQFRWLRRSGNSGIEVTRKRSNPRISTW